MSVVLAIKKNGRIYMAADSQSTCGDTKYNHINEVSRKVSRFENGMLLGRVGMVHNCQIICAHPEYFTLPEDGKLTKKYVVQNIIPKIFKCYRDNEMRETEKDEPAKLGDSYLLAHRDKLFLMNGVFDVTEVTHYAAIGSGNDMALAGLCALDAEEISDEKIIEDRLAEILRISASHDVAVSGPYFLIDTVGQNYKMVH